MARLGVGTVAMVMVALLGAPPVNAAPVAAPAGPCPLTGPISSQPVGEDDPLRGPGLFGTSDLSDDGASDALLLTEDTSFQSGDAAVMGVDGPTGTDLWPAPVRGDAVYESGDLDADGLSDLIVMNSDITWVDDVQRLDQTLQGVSGRTGAILWTTSSTGLINFQGGYHQRLIPQSSLADLDGDGAKDIVVGHSFYEPQLGYPRAVFRSISGRTGSVIATYGPGVGTWMGFAALSQIVKQVPVAITVPDLSGDCLPDVVVTTTRTQANVVTAFTGNEGVLEWQNTFVDAEGARLTRIMGGYLDADTTGDVLLGFGQPNGGGVGASIGLFGLSGIDGQDIWITTFPQNGSQIELVTDQQTGTNDVLMAGNPNLSTGTAGLVDGRTGVIAWTQEFVGDADIAGDVDADGVDDILVGHQSCVQGCVDTGATLLSGVTGSEIWTRASLIGERLVPAAADVDGDGADDLFAVLSSTEQRGGAYTVVSGRTSAEMWGYSRWFEDPQTLFILDTLDITATPGVDVLEMFDTPQAPGRVGARHGSGGSSIWSR